MDDDMDDGFFDDDFHHHDQGSQFGALEFGLAYGFAGHLADRQTERITDAIGAIDLQPPPVVVEPEPVLINAAEGKTSADWDFFHGQEPMKRQLRVHIDSAKARGVALDHVLLASGIPGVGKSHFARIIAKEMGGEFVMLVPPFHRSTLHEAAISLSDIGVLFIDEIHKLADHSKAAAENLLHILDEHRIYADEGIIELNDITVIGATTERDKLPKTVIDRFSIKPFFQPYTPNDLDNIVVSFEVHNGVELHSDLRETIADACQGTPRIARELVRAARDIYHAWGRYPTCQELLDFKELTGDGLTRGHRNYLTKLLMHFERQFSDGRIEHMAGETALMTMLRETKDGLRELERFLMEKGYIDRSPQGRRLTDEGHNKALFIAIDEGLIK